MGSWSYSVQKTQAVWLRKFSACSGSGDDCVCLCTEVSAHLRLGLFNVSSPLALLPLLLLPLLACLLACSLGWFDRVLAMVTGCVFCVYFWLLLFFFFLLF